MRVLALGPVEVRDEGNSIGLGGPKPKALLVALLQQMLPRREDWLAIVHELRSGVTLEQLRARLESARSRLIELELEALHGLFPAGTLSEAAVVAHGAAEEDHGAAGGLHAPVVDRADGQHLLGETEPRVAIDGSMHEGSW